MRITWSNAAKKALHTDDDQRSRWKDLMVKVGVRANAEKAARSLATTRADRSSSRHQSYTGWYGGTVDAKTIAARRAKNKRARQARAMHRSKR